MKRHWWRSVLWWGLWILWCGLIYYVSAHPAFTGEHTAHVIQQAAPTPVRGRPGLVQALNVAVRKSGHLLGFAVLGALSLAAVSAWPRPPRGALWAWILATLYAVTDEWHQAYVPGRTGTLRDVVLDAAGAALGVALAAWAVRGRTRDN